MTKQRGMFLAVTLMATPLGAQSFQTATPNTTVISSMGSRYIANKCTVKANNHLVSSAATYYKQSFDAKDAAAKMTQLRSANRVSQEAIVDMKQDQNGAAWYWLARTYLQQGDVPGADSAMKRAEKLLPECAEELKSYRRVAYGAVITPAFDLLKMNKNDSAIMMFRVANMLSDESPAGYYNMAVAFGSANPDSAIHYFKIAQRISSVGTQYRNELTGATAILVQLYQAKGDEAEALSEARRLIQLAPAGDLDAKRLLYSVVARSKDPALQAEARVIEAELTAAAEADGSITAAELSRLGYLAYREQTEQGYTKALGYFKKGYAKEPWRRDILYNVINAHFALGQFAEMIDGLRTEIEAEPLSEEYHKLLVRSLTGLQRTKEDSTRLLDAATVWTALPVGIMIDPIDPTNDGVKLVGEVTGLSASDGSGRPIPARAITLVVEFLDQKGAVVATKEATIPLLQPDAKHSFTVEAAGKGIVDFRYHEKKP